MMKKMVAGKIMSQKSVLGSVGRTDARYLTRTSQQIEAETAPNLSQRA